MGGLWDGDGEHTLSSFLSDTLLAVNFLKIVIL